MISYKGKSTQLHFIGPSNGTGPFLLDLNNSPSGVPVSTGDWIITTITTKANVAASVEIILPTDWVWLMRPKTPGTGTTSVGYAAYIRREGDGPYSFGKSVTTAEQKNGAFISFLWGSGASDPSNWKVGPTWARLGSDTTLVRAPQITTTTNGSTVLAIAADRTIAAETDSQVNVRTDSGWTKFAYMAKDDQFISIVAKEFGNAGSITENVIIDYPNPHVQNGLGLQIEIPPSIPVATQPPPVVVPSGITVRTLTSKGYTEGRLKVVWGNALVTPKAIKQIPSGYSSVSEMLSQKPFYVAHRGGSRDFPEMSKYAYGQSAMLGYGALELSLARTSDGVWFGLHDDSIDRTSGVVTGKTASQMTWAEVQQYRILGKMAAGNNTQPDRPYMRWEELMEVYYSTHVIFIDPKAAMNFREELYSMMDAMPGTPTDRFVGKYYGVVGGSPQQPSAFPAQLEARGYHRWGYFYQTDAANFEKYAPRWSILGMDYNADQASWDAIKSFGKPVMGHITPTLTAFDTAISKGADGMMIAGVKSVAPVRSVIPTPIGGLGVQPLGTSKLGGL